jgi:acyl carrier protein
MTEEIKMKVKAFIIENFLFGEASDAIADDASLIENDVVDSTGVLELVAFIEDQFAITVADTDIVPANLDSIARISGFIERKMDEGSGALSRTA